MNILCPGCNKLLMVIEQSAGWKGSVETVCRRCPKDPKTGETAKVRISFPHPLGSEWVPSVEKI